MTGFKVTDLWAYVQVGEDGDEGILAMLHQGVWLPMIGADEARLKSLRGAVVALARATGRRVELRHFAGPAEVVDVLESVKKP